MSTAAAYRLQLVAFYFSAIVWTASSAPLMTVSETDKDQVNAVTEQYPVGDPRRCLLIEKSNGLRLRRFSVLPGTGWDNLRNVDEGGQMVVFNFSQCHTTDDGRFLLPDSVTAVPILSSSVQTSAELIEDMKDWTSTTAQSLNVDVGIKFGFVSISGKFSEDFQEMKKKQTGDESYTARAQVRYIRYAVHLQPDTPLHPVFKGRLLDIAAAHEMNETRQARYLSQLLVRDFGTHIITSAVAGAALMKIDNLNKNWVKQNEEKKLSIRASASVSLFNLFSMGIDSGYSTDASFTSEYMRQITSSQIKTYGGPVYEPTNFSTNMWAERVDDNLVFMDRSGDPLHYFVTAAALTELPISTLQEVSRSVQKAIEAYYTFNLMPGCTDPESPNFSPAANFDDSTCKPPTSFLKFGGVYQTCDMSAGSNNGDLCGEMRQGNPMTGQASCPAGYEAVLLHQGGMSTARSEHHCNYFLFWETSCWDDYFQSSASFVVYWCVAPVKDNRTNSGYLLGGVYTSELDNPVTQDKSCPPSFINLKVGSEADLHICVTEDYEFGQPYAVSFGGFLSCTAGNPLSLSGNTGSSAGFQGEPGSWPQRCPDGYSKHLATIDQGCAISYCVETNTLKAPHLPPIRRPPFMRTPSLPRPPEDNRIVFDRTSRTWYRNADAKQYLDMIALQPASKAGSSIAQTMLSSSYSQGAQLKQSAQTTESASNWMSPGASAGVAVVLTLVCVLLVAGVVLAVRKYRRHRAENYCRMEELHASHAQYSASSNGATSVNNGDH